MSRRSQLASSVPANTPLLASPLCHLEAFLELLGGVNEKNEDGEWKPYMEQEERAHPMTELEAQSVL